MGAKYARVERLLWIGIVVAAVMGVSSMAYAAATNQWTTNDSTARGQAVAGTVGWLEWSNNTVVTSSNSYVACSTLLSVGAPQLHWYAKNLGPGDYCIGTANLTYTGGSLPVSLAQTFYPYNHWACGYVYDTIEVMESVTVGPAQNGASYAFGVSANVTMQPNTTIVVTFAVGEWSDAPQSCAGLGADYDVNVTGVVSGGDGP